MQKEAWIGHRAFLEAIESGRVPLVDSWAVIVLGVSPKRKSICEMGFGWMQSLKRTGSGCLPAGGQLSKVPPCTSLLAGLVSPLMHYVSQPKTRKKRKLIHFQPFGLGCRKQGSWPLLDGNSDPVWQLECSQDMARSLGSIARSSHQLHRSLHLF